MEGYDQSEIDPVLKGVCSHWISKIQQARRHKTEVFQASADECLQFYAGPKSWDDLMGRGTGMECEVPELTFKMHVNKTFEYVTLYGPALYYENPVRTVGPRQPVQIPPEFVPNPMVFQALAQQENARVMADGLRGQLIEGYLNWTPNEFGLMEESRLGTSEALIKGRGCMWPQLYTPPGASFKVVRSTWDSTDNLLVDPDAPSLDKATWIAQRCVLPVWQVERDYDLKRGAVRGQYESQAAQGVIESSTDAQHDRRRGLTNDLVVYYKVWSRMGLGGRLQGIKRTYRDPLEMFGDYAYIVVAENCPFPLNLPPDVQNDPAFLNDPQAIFDRVAWPIPTWADDDWPVSVLDFHPVHNSPWPLPPLKAAMGELRFLNWAMSFLAGRIRTSCRDFIAMKKSVGEEMKTALLEGKDLTILELEPDHGRIDELVQFLQHPEINGDVWKVIEAVETNFDKRMGLNELMYGDTSTQIRSAEEANIRNRNVGVRPDDMAKVVEAWQARIAAKEALAARYLLTPDDIRPVMGPMAAVAWGQYVSTHDLVSACRQLEYRIEAGSTRKPNKDFQVRQMTEALQAIGPILQGYAQMTGDLEPLSHLLEDFAKSRDLNPARYSLKPMPPPQMAPVPPGADPNQAGAPQEGPPARNGAPKKSPVPAGGPR